MKDAKEDTKNMNCAIYMDYAIFKLFEEGILTKRQRYYCDQKLKNWAVRKNIKWYKEIR